MKQQRDQKLARLRERLRRGEYAVDPAAVAEAILQRCQGADAARDRGHSRRGVRAR
ncbi:MAG: flagellar biosynthesis anti-sigma factor FlgM [Solirubrobacteraceae bacterium]